MILLAELGAQIHCLQLFSGIKRGLGPRMKARRNVLTRETHSREVLLRELVVEILLRRESHKLAKCHNCYAVFERITNPCEDTGRLCSVED